MKKDEYMESDLSGIFRVNVIAKNIVPNPLEPSANSTLVSFM